MWIDLIEAECLRALDEYRGTGVVNLFYNGLYDLQGQQANANNWGSQTQGGTYSGILGGPSTWGAVRWGSGSNVI